MSNVTIYLDDMLEKRLRQAAKDQGVSVSKLVAQYVREKTVSTWPNEFMNLAGSWPELNRPETNADLPREPL
ncbi:MAG: CopG family transcriptional regulator [Planctomycetota bacterium]